MHGGDNNKNKLNEEAKLFIDRLIALLKKRQIKLFGSYPTSSIALYFQCETDVSQEWLVDFCENGGLNSELKALYRILQPELNRFPNGPDHEAINIIG